jgi:uncharacterized membrane protein YphA (DoxX/SURF4 family)
MTYWLGACVFALEYGLHMDASGTIRSLSLLLFRLDFAAIMLSAGFYKVVCGYPKNEGMELGMVNPWWGYWWRYYQKLPPNHIFFRTLNHLAYGTEIVAGVLMLIPGAASLGAWLVIVSFLFIATQIRLGFLTEMITIAALIYMEPGSFADQMSGAWIELSASHPQPAAEIFGSFNLAVAVFLGAYILMLPWAHAGLWYNFLARRSFVPSIQTVLERYTNFFGIIIWRVFTVDLVNFFVRIYVVNTTTGERTSYYPPGVSAWRSRFRYRHVGEFVCLASIFTTLKYYPSNRSLFDERLMRYARTVHCLPGSVVVFEYRDIQKQFAGFEFIPVVEYIVDTCRRTIRVNLLDKSFAVQGHGASPLHEGSRPGSYAPLKGATASRA